MQLRGDALIVSALRTCPEPLLGPGPDEVLLEEFLHVVHLLRQLGNAAHGGLVPWPAMLLPLPEPFPQLLPLPLLLVFLPLFAPFAAELHPIATCCTQTAKNTRQEIAQPGFNEDPLGLALNGLRQHTHTF